MTITEDNYHLCVIISQFVWKWMNTVALISSAIVIWIMGISCAAKKYISLDINLCTTILFACRWTLVRMRKKGILLIIVIKCMPVSISLLGGNRDGFSDLYRETTWFANYLNSKGHLYRFLKTQVLRLCSSLWKEVLSWLLVSGQVTLVNFLMSFRWVYQPSFPFDWGIKMHGGLPLSVRIWKKNKKYCQHERQPASLSRRMIALHKSPSGERVKWDWNPDRILEVDGLVTHN